MGSEKWEVRKELCRTVVILLFGLLGAVAPAHDASGQNFFMILGKDAGLTEGDRFHRSVYFIEVPETHAGKIYVRIFDADLSGRYDKWEEGSEVRYLIYGKHGINRKLCRLSDPLPSTHPLAALGMGKNPYYDNQWQSIGELDPADGELKNGRRCFQLLVDGVRGRANNKYQLFVSSEKKRNRPVRGLHFYTPVANLRVPANPAKVTQIRFRIPRQAEYLNVETFDADHVEYRATINFETRFRKNVPVTASDNAETELTKIVIQPEERGQYGAIVIGNEKFPNNIQIRITDNRGNTLPLLLPVLIAPQNHLPVAKFSAIPLSQCFSLMLDASESADPDGDELTFEWIFENGAKEKGGRIVRDFKKPGKHRVTLVVSENSGFVADSSRITRTLSVNAPPRANIRAPARGIPHDDILFDASGSSDRDGKILRYRWDFGDGEKSSAGSVTTTHSYATPGTYRISLTVEDDGQSLCSQDEISHEIRINMPPLGRVNVRKRAAVGEVVELSATGSADSDGEIVGYEWDFGDGAVAEGESVTHTWQKPGNYLIHLGVRDDAGLPNSLVPATGEIVINAPPVPAVKTKEVAAAEEYLLFDASASHDPDGDIDEYIWDMGDGVLKQGREVRHAYEAPGTYEGMLTVRDNSDVANDMESKAFSIRINYPPVPRAGQDQVVNESEVFFDAGNSADQDDPLIAYLWDFGDNSSAEGKEVSHVYAIPGAYRVKLTVTDASGTETASQSDWMTVTVNHPPVADAGRDQFIAFGEKVTLDGGFSLDPDGDILSHKWEIGQGEVIDTNIREGKKQTYEYEQPGIYQAYLSVRDNHGAEAYDAVTITVNAAPVPDFPDVGRIAPGQTVLFDAASSRDPDGQITDAEWNFGDGTLLQKSGSSAEHAFSNPGRYTVRLTVRDNSNVSNSTASLTRAVEVNYPPKADAGRDIHTCDQHVLFDGSGSTDGDGDPLNWHWDFGDGTGGKGMKTGHMYAAPGIYPITLTVDDGKRLGNSKAMANIRVYVNAPPLAVAGANRETICAGESVLFDGSRSEDLEKGLLRYLWDFGDGRKGEGVNPVVRYDIGGDYRIRLTVLDDSGLPCNSGVAEMVLHVTDAPVAFAGEDQTVCAGAVVLFDGSESRGGGRPVKSYEWDFGDSKKGVTVGPTHTYFEPGQYNVRLRISVSDTGECNYASEDELTVTVIPAPEVLFEILNTKFETQKPCPDLGVKLKPGSVSSDLGEISQAVELAKNEGCVGEELIFDAGASNAYDSEIVEFVWDFGDGKSDRGEKVPHVYEVPGTYTVKLRIRTDSEQKCKVGELSKKLVINAVPSAVIRLNTSDAPPFVGERYDTSVNTLLHFDGTESGDSDGHIAEYVWDMGDGHKKSGVAVSHQYEKPASYQVKLLVRDNSHAQCNETLSLMTLSVHERPALSVKGPEDVCVGQSLEYSAVLNTHQGGNSGDTSNIPQMGRVSGVSEWFFGDGTSGKGEKTAKIFKRPGTYQVFVSRGNLRSSARTVRVWKLPEIQLPEKVELYPDDSFEFRVSNFELNYCWDMGDGTVLEKGAAPSLQKEKLPELVSHVYRKPGEYEVKLTLSSKKGPECMRTEYAFPMIVHPPPVAEIEIEPERLFTGGARDAAKFKAVIINGHGEWNCEWDFGDGGKAWGKQVSHAYTESGEFEVTLTLSHVLNMTEQTYSFSNRIEVERRK